jgi:hypothetical protein
MTATATAGSSPPARAIACAIFRVSEGGLSAVTLAGPDDELVLVVQAQLGFERRNLHPALDVEVWRGDRLRDRRRVDTSDLGAGPHAACFRLHRGDSPTASARLLARVLVAGAEVARSEVLLGRPCFDGQGRIASSDDRSASDQTLLAFARGLGRIAGSADF